MGEEGAQNDKNNLVYFKSNKGSMNHGFVYTNNRSWNKTVHWKYEQCDEYHGRMNVKNGQITKRKDHSHAPDKLVAIVQDAMSNMKENYF